ncbi:MAG: OmpA family protein [Sphingomicrobium sp.]
MIFLALALLQAAPDHPKYVFFDWGKSEITRDASATLDAIASEYRDGMRIQVVGHSDRSGSKWSNRASSRKRAQAVRDYLVGKGVSESAIAVSAVGENAPIIVTADGVREVQNRRVEISVERP